ncbi:HlyD family secretion protein [Shewanella sp. Isolate11]|uniref:HlyD family secretion protein n=1 Tax=Shewanella sp. Isolate11 TaxID=2908530 RepID=UPI001EFE47BB|nr:HlyD family secretion protein [Shewanella sp. Isolate11]MCG9697680.1 HlyD family secretion protein [Shewanella sp. Isolate11]
MSEVNQQIAPVELAPKASKAKRWLLLFVVPVVVVLGCGAAYLHGGRYVETDNAYVKADKTSIAAEVSGVVIDVPVVENQQVKAGQLLLKIDPKPYEIAVEQAKANLSDVNTSLTALKAEYDSKQANIEVEQSQYQYLQREQLRQQDLLTKKYTSQADFDSAKQKTRMAELQIQALRKDLKQLVESLGGDVNAPISQHPKYLSALAALDKAQNDLRHVDVYAPTDGVVTKVAKKGQYMTPGSLTMMMVADHNLWVEANFTETEVSYMKVGQSVEIKVDYAPDFEWTGKVESISPATGSEYSVIPAENATGNWVKITQRVPVRIYIGSADKANAPQLRAGLSTIVTVDTQHQRHLSL